MDVFKQKRAVIIAFIIIVVVALLIWMLVGSGGVSDKNQEVSASDPISVVLDFYEPWMSARWSTSTDPYKEGLAKAGILSPDLREKLADSKDGDELEIILE